MVNHSSVFMRQCPIPLSVVVHGPQGIDNSVSIMGVIHQNASFAQGFLLRANVRRHAWHPEQTCLANDPDPRPGRLEENEVEVNAGKEGRRFHVAQHASIGVMSEFLRAVVLPAMWSLGETPLKSTGCRLYTIDSDWSCAH